MDAFFKDVKFGNFIATEHNLVAVSFDDSSSDEDDFGMESDTEEEYLGRNTIPLDYGSTHQGKQSFEITFMKDPCKISDQNDMALTDFEVRAILRELTGKQYYQNLYLYDGRNHYDEPVHFRAKVTETSRQVVNGLTMGLKFGFECDSFWMYTDELSLDLRPKANQNVYFYNSSDELNDYLLPILEITIGSAADSFTITNKSDNDRQTKITTVSSGEIITLDSLHTKISSSKSGRLIADDFNMKWVKLVPDENILVFSQNCSVTMKYTLLRKRCW